MYVDSHPQRARTALGLACLVTLGLVVPVCGISPHLVQRHIDAPVLRVPPTRIQGMGLNVHDDPTFPIDKLKAIGVKWVRFDLVRNATPETISKLKEHYRDFGQLWIDHQQTGDPVGSARLLVSCGVTDIEVLNEPEQNGYDPGRYGALFREVRAASAGRARLYGPCTGDWPHNKRYLESALDAGMVPDVISFHGYDERRPEDFAAWVAEARAYGVPVVISELAFPDYNGPTPYRLRMGDSLENLMFRTARTLAGTAWCFYDAANSPHNNGCGLFDQNPRTGQWDVPNANYQAVLRAATRLASK